MKLEAHSPLGASAAARFMMCAGSVTQSYGVYDEDSEYSELGTAAHYLAADALKKGYDAWERVGYELPGGLVVDENMSDAVQEYVVAVREAHPDRNQGNFFVEHRFHCPTLHDYFYGIGDTIYLDIPERHLHIWDYKHGAGIIVEVPWNEQTMYYGCGALESFDLWDSVDKITLHIAQPRGWHPAGNIREWTITVSDLWNWLYDVLIPAMDVAMVSRDTIVGPHCRFCPARRRACPAMMDNWTKLQEMLAMIKKDSARKLTAKEQGVFLDAYDVAKIAQKPIAKDAFDIINKGGKVPGRKIVSAIAFRQFKKGSERALEKKFGEEAFEPKKLRSPAQIEMLTGGKAFAARYAFKPPSGGTLVREDDIRMGLSKATKSMFSPVKKKK